MSTPSSPPSASTTVDGIDSVEESESTRIERLGRQRPEKLTSVWQEIGFVFSIVMSQALTEYFFSGITILIPTIATDLGIPPQRVTWPVGAFSLVISAFLLPFGRLADIHGGKWVYVLGIAWTCVWALITGFAKNEYMLDICRAVQALGAAAYLPSGLMLLGSTYRPGPRKNVIFAIYGAMAAFGFFVGLLFAGISGQYTGWRWYCYIGSILSLIIALVSIVSIPNDRKEHVANDDIQMDWWGSAAIICGLILFVYAITDSAHSPQGWRTWYILVTFFLGIALLGIAFYIEGWVVEQPLIPFEALNIKYVPPFILGLLFCFGVLGVYILYATLYIRNVIGIGPFQLVAWYAPLGIGGCILATIGGFIFHLIDGSILMLISGFASIIAPLLFALRPENGGYWPWVFPAMLCATIAIDLLFTVATIFFSTTLPSRHQGFAGALTNVLLQLGIALLLGVADVVSTNTRYQGEKQSYKNAFWFELACAAAGLAIFMGFVRIDKAKSDKTADEKAAEKRREREVSSAAREHDLHKMTITTK